MVPPQAVPGVTRVRKDLPDGRSVEGVVPKGARPGDHFHVPVWSAIVLGHGFLALSAGQARPSTPENHTEIAETADEAADNLVASPQPPMARAAVDDLSDLDEATVEAIRAAVDHQERRELQRLAKLRGIKANQKSAVLVEELARRLAAHDAGARSATPPPPAVPVPAPVPASIPAVPKLDYRLLPPPRSAPGAPPPGMVDLVVPPQAVPGVTRVRKDLPDGRSVEGVVPKDARPGDHFHVPVWSAIVLRHGFLALSAGIQPREPAADLSLIHI